MNINTNQLNIQRVQTNNTIAKSFNTQATSPFSSKTENDTDQLSISSGGKAKSMAMRHIRHGDNDDMKANMEVFSATYQELDIASLDADNMTDEEILAALQSFEDALGDSKPEQMVAASTMSSEGRIDALKNLQNIASSIEDGVTKSDGYQQVRGKRPPPPKDKPIDATESTDETSDSAELLQELLDAIAAESEDNEETNSIFSNTSIQEVLTKIASNLSK